MKEILDWYDKLPTTVQIILSGIVWGAALITWSLVYWGIFYG